jgi:hypothetical protein
VKTQTISFEQWRREAPRLRAKSAEVLARFGPAQREKPRSAAEVEFLRGTGTPEHLIGPRPDARLRPLRVNRYDPLGVRRHRLVGGRSAPRRRAACRSASEPSGARHSVHP